MQPVSHVANPRMRKYFRIVLPPRLCWALLACFILAVLTIPGALAQIPDITAGQQSEPEVSDESVQTMFPHFKEGRFWISGQANFIFQTHEPFYAEYSGPHSLQPDYEKATSRVLTLYTGLQITKSIEVLLDIEEAGGQGLSGALGVAGFTNLDVVRNPTLGQAPYLSRAMYHQVFALSNEKVESPRGPLSTFSELPARRLEFRF